MMNFLAAYTLPGTSLGNKVHQLQKPVPGKGSLYKLEDSKHLPFSITFLKANQRACGGNAHDSGGGGGVGGGLNSLGLLHIHGGLVAMWAADGEEFDQAISVQHTLVLGQTPHLKHTCHDDRCTA